MEIDNHLDEAPGRLKRSTRSPIEKQRDNWGTNALNHHITPFLRKTKIR